MSLRALSTTATVGTITMQQQRAALSFTPCCHAPHAMTRRVRRSIPAFGTERPAVLGSHRLARLQPLAASLSVDASSLQHVEFEDTELQIAPGPSSQQEPLAKRLLKAAAKTTAVVALGLLLMFGRVLPASAARSAGRVGGFSGGGGTARSFSSASRSSSSSGGFGGGGYGGGGGFGGGYGGSLGGSRVVPSPSLYGSGVFGGGSSSYGGYVSSYSGTRSGGVVVSTTADESALADLIGTVVVMLVILTFISTAGSTGSATSYGAARSVSQAYSRPTTAPLALTKVQVGALALARELKAELDVIADASETSSSDGLHKLLQATVSAIQRNPAYAVYGAASQQGVASERDLERSFNTASMEVREKFEQETLVNVRGRRKNSTYTHKTDTPGVPDELVVVTLLVATRSKVSGMPAGRITTAAQLQEALSALKQVPAGQVMGVEVMWTPQAPGDYYTRDEIIADFPELMPL